VSEVYIVLIFSIVLLAGTYIVARYIYSAVASTLQMLHSILVMMNAQDDENSPVGFQ